MFRKPLEEGGGGFAKRTKSELAAEPLPSGGPTKGGNATSPPHSRESPNKGGQNQNWLPNPCLLGAHGWEEMLCHPCILDYRQQKGQNQSTKRKQKNTKIKIFP